MAFGILIGIATLALASRDWLGSKLSLVSNARLREMIASLSIRTIRTSTIPLDCTASSKVWYQFPFFPNEWSEAIPLRQITVPVYQRINNLHSDDDIVEWLLQTAAIPEIFRSKRMHGLYLVDGGVVDNTPILPTLDSQPETIIAIYLNRKLACHPDIRGHEKVRLWRLAERVVRAHLTDRSEAEAIRRKWRYALQVAYSRQRYPDGWVSKVSDPFPGRDLHEPTILPKRNAFVVAFEQAEFVPIVPSRHLGGIIRGTLNFSRRKARRLLALGYEDTLRKLLQIAREPATSSVTEKCESAASERSANPCS